MEDSENKNLADDIERHKQMLDWDNTQSSGKQLKKQNLPGFPTTSSDAVNFQRDGFIRNLHRNYGGVRSQRGGLIQNGNFPSHANSNRGQTQEKRYPFECHLVSMLILKQRYECNIGDLQREFNLNYNGVKKAVVKHPTTFSLVNDIIKLSPQIRVCQDHITRGCSSSKCCSQLHMCELYLKGVCVTNNCALGHTIKTNHNMIVLRKFYLNHLSENELTCVIRSVTAESCQSGTPQLVLCSDYNCGGCDAEDCSKLHICEGFLVGSCRDNKTCSRSHWFTEKRCTRLLKLSGISTKDSPKDIIMQIRKALPSLEHKCQEAVKPAGTGGFDAKKTDASMPASPSRDEHRLSERVSSEEASDSASLDSDSDLEEEEEAELHGQDATVWSHYACGTVKDHEICYDSVEGLCPFEGTGCNKLHSCHHYHWQISEDGSRWVNLMLDLVESLEIAYCDPYKDDVDLTLVGDDISVPCNLGTLSIIGRLQWKAHFDSMTLDCPDDTRVLQLRRLHTDHKEDEALPGCQFIWYFCDKNSKWVKYADVDTAGETDLKSDVTSADIEKEFKAGSTSMNFKNSRFAYVLDFSKMVQTNQETRVQRAVKRRPCKHIFNKAVSGDIEEKLIKVPETWEAMLPDEHVRRVVLATSSDEYNEILTFLNQQNARIRLHKIERVQNPFSWRAFQNRLQEMIIVYGSEDAVNVTRLFHGTRLDVVGNICSENFDWRLHGTNVGHAYGCGAYFSNQFSTALSYCKGDSSGYNYMFIAKVAVGALVVGNSSMVHPPINPITSMPYSSSGNSMHNPNIIVKYDKQESYPEYILTFS